VIEDNDTVVEHPVEHVGKAPCVRCSFDGHRPDPVSRQCFRSCRGGRNRANAVRGKTFSAWHETRAPNELSKRDADVSPNARNSLRLLLEAANPAHRSMVAPEPARDALDRSALPCLASFRELCSLNDTTHLGLSILSQGESRWTTVGTTLGS
jgi:hypothetical protein